MSDSKWQQDSDDEEFSLFNYDEPEVSKSEELDGSDEESGDSNAETEDLEDPTKLQDNEDSDELGEDSGEEEEGEDTSLLSLEDKVKQLQGDFKSFPPLMIKRVLQREDVKGDLHAARSCLKGMSSMEESSKTGLQANRNGGSESNKGKRQNAPKVFPKKKYEKSGKCENRTTLIEEKIEIEDATVAERASEAQGVENPFGFGNEELDIEDMENEDAEYLSLEEKVKILQEDFKGFPPFVIRKVLGRQDVKEDLQKAIECLKNMSPLKGTFKDRDGGGEDASQEQKDRGRRQACEQKKGKTQENQGKDSSDKTDEEPSQHCRKGAAGVSGGAQGNSGKNPQKNKRKNRSRNRKQNQGGNERNAENMGRPGPSDSIPREGWPGGYQQGGYHQQWGQGEFPQQPWGPGGYPQLQWGYPQEVHGGFNPGDRPRGRGRHNREGNQRGYFPKGDGRDYQRGHAGNYYHVEANFGPHQWAGHGHGQRPGYPYNEGYPMPNQSAFHRSQSEADIRNDGVLQRGNRGQARQRCNSRGSDELNPQNARGRGGHRWVGRGAGRGTKQQTAAPQITSIQDEIQNFEPNMILVRGLNTSTTFDAIRNFIEARTSEEVRDVARVGDGNALVTVGKLSDFEKAKENVKERTLDGAKVTIHRVPVTSSILVRNLSPDTTHDVLEFYFSNQRIGGEITSIQYEKGNSQAVVTFKDPEIMQKVLRSKSLKLNDAKLTAERFNPTIQESNQRQHSKDEIAVAVEKDVMEFISTTNCVNELKETLSGLGFDMNYTAGDTIVYIAPKTTAKDSANKQRGIKAVTDFAKKFKTIELDVDTNHWDAVTSEISKLQKEIGKNKLLLKEASFSKDKVTIICRNCDAEGLKRKFSENIAETQTLEVKKTYEKNEMPVEEEKLALLKKIGFKEKHLSEYSELEAEIDQDSGAITMIGPKKQCSEAKIKIYKHLSKMSERKIPLSQTVFEMLSTDEGLERIKAELMKKQLETVFCIDENNEESTASVVGINKKHADDAAELIKSITTEIKVRVDKDMMEVLRTQKWSDLCDEIKRYFKVYVRRNEFFDTWIAGFKEDVSSAHDRILRFLDDNSVGTEKFCCLDQGVRRYILEHRKEEISKMESTLTQYSVKIKPGEAADAFLISGTKIGVARVRKALHILTGSVAMNEMKVQQPGLHKFFTSGRGDRLVKSVEHEHQCTIYKVENASQEAKPLPAQDVRVSDGSFDSTSSSESDEEDQASAQAYLTASIPTGPMSMTCGNVKISWKPGNIETESADILVGSTIGQLSKVFQRAGVPQMQQHRGNVSLVSQCGNLPCNYVILTKCCNWDGGNGAAEMQLRSIVQQCLQQALQMNASSLAFPVIGTGEFGFPNNTASRIMISEVINITSGWGTSSLNDIRFVVFAQDTQLTNAFQQEFTAFSSGSHTVQGRGSSHFRFSGPNSSPRKSAFGNVLVQVYQGNIVQEQTDAIVNINSTDMNMQNAGALSKAVAVAAGPSVQNECTNLGQQNPGSAVVTRAGNLMVPNIIHMIPGNADKQHIQSCIEKCLQVADSNGFQSISMPAFGTGSYGMSDADSAQATFQALANECPNLQSLGQVNIVIFQLQMVRTFQQTLQQYAAGSFKQSKPRKPASATKTTKASGVSKKSGSVDDFVRTIQFRLFGKGQDCVDKAQTTLTKGLTEAFKTQTVENENASKLSERQRLKLETKARELDVIIKFEDRIQRIVVRGDPEDVSGIINDIWEEIQERHKKEKESEQAEVLYKTIKWQYELHGKRKYFNKSSNAVIEKAHANNDSRVTVEVQGEKYVIVFAQSTGTGLSMGQKMTVTRTTVGSAAGHGEGIALPKEWSPMPKDSSGKEATVHLVALTPGSAEYRKVLNLFQSTGGTGRVISIERIQNPHLYQQYMVRKQKMDKDNPGTDNERQLFHGTADKNVNDIIEKGFNRSYCGAHGVAYGKGVYFARDASYSMGYSQSTGNQGYLHQMIGLQRMTQHGSKGMFLARVLVGKYTKGNSSMIVPPRGFDSVTNTSGPDASIFVVFYDSQCYPEYLIAFQDSWEHGQERFKNQSLPSTEEARIFVRGRGSIHRFLIRDGSQHHLPQRGIAFEVPSNAFKDTPCITCETFSHAFPPPTRKDLDEVLVSDIVVLRSNISHSGKPLVITLTHSGADKTLGYETVVKAVDNKHERSWTELEEHKSDRPKPFTSNCIQVQIKIPTTLAVVSRLITDRFEVTPDKRCVVTSSVSDDVTVEFPEGAADKPLKGTMKLLFMPENMHHVKDACPVLCIDGFAGVTFTKPVIVKMPRPSKSEYQTKGNRLLRLDEPLKKEWEDITDDVHIIGYKTYIEFHVKHFSWLWPWTSSKNTTLATTLFRHLRSPPRAVCFAAFKDNNETLCRSQKLTLVCVANHKQYETVSNMRAEGYTRLAVCTADRKMRPNDEAYTRIDGAAMETQRFFLRFLKNEVCRKELRIRDTRHDEQNQEELVVNFFPNEEEDCDLLLCSLQMNKGIIFRTSDEQIVEEEAQTIEGAVANLPSEEGDDEDVRKLVLSFGNAVSTVSAAEVAGLLPKYLNVSKTMSEDPPPDVIKKCHQFCRILKNKGRKDIVKALKRELPSGMTGPLLDGDILIKNLDHATKLKLSRALTVTDKWRSFAERIKGITMIDIEFYSEREVNPVLAVLDNHCGKMTIDEVYGLIVESGANAIADLL